MSVLYRCLFFEKEKIYLIYVNKINRKDSHDRQHQYTGDYQKMSSF